MSPPSLQGGILGVGQSVGSMARIVGPAMAGLAFDVGLAMPYLLGASVAALASVLAAGMRPGFGLPQPAPATRVASD